MSPSIAIVSSEVRTILPRIVSIRLSETIFILKDTLYLNVKFPAGILVANTNQPHSCGRGIRAAFISQSQYFAVQAVNNRGRSSDLTFDVFSRLPAEVDLI